ncbi:hypothetical protein COCON_G00225750 [Conger conger]|uniref:YqgF/RNase H-like domain-containing protein n=1 Tax=Conger conger TaxID=82655 RepID=A0A9Q1HNI6_CONCO|nr:hypothetical protein COCON_G00225750 [Conger conger]
MIRRTRPKMCYKEPSMEEDDFEDLPKEEGAEDEEEEEEDAEDEEDDWQPEAVAPKRPRKAAPAPKKPAEKKPAVRKPAKPRAPREPKPRAPRKVAEKRPRAPRGKKKEAAALEQEAAGGEEAGGVAGDAAAPHLPVNVKEERLSFRVPESGPSQEFPSNQQSLPVKKEEPEDDFTFGEPVAKKLKTSEAPQGRPLRQPKAGKGLPYDLQMNWDPIQVLSEMTQVERWVCANMVDLFREENTIPFMVRYRKELINHMDADGVREVQLVLEDLCAVSKKSQSISQTLNKEGVLTSEIQEMLKNCRTQDDLEHVYAPYKKGSKLSKARRAKQLGLEPASIALLQDPQKLNLHAYINPQSEGLTTLEEVATGVAQIVADTIAKDKETLAFVRSLCERNQVTLHSCVSKTALKEQQQQQQPMGERKGKPKDIDKFHLYCDFTSNVQRIQHHQTLAINRGESLKILTVKVNIPDRVKSEFCRWCVNVSALLCSQTMRLDRAAVRSTLCLPGILLPDGYASNELMKILNDAVEDSYKRLIQPLLCRGYRSTLTASAEKESIAMFVRNLRQRLLVCPVRGRPIMGVDPGFRHGCKLAILSPTSQILHTDVVYLHQGGGAREADKLRFLMMKYSCQTIAIGNGTACRETEEFFAGLIAKKFFLPLDVSYCIINEAGASIYSVSPEAVKEMPDLDPNIRSAVSIGRRVQDPLAELVKIEPKHIGIGTYQHDVSQTALKAALDSVVEECVSFVGVDINICSETLMR